jgi:hypothetical protein
MVTSPVEAPLWVLPEAQRALVIASASNNAKVLFIIFPPEKIDFFDGQAIWMII